MRVFALVVLVLGAAFASVAAPLSREPYRGAIAADSSGRVLFEDRADEPAYPASVTKLMVALLVTEDIRAGRYTYETTVTATEDVRKSEPSWLDLKAGEKMSVRDLMYALLVSSANDAAIALAVRAEGSIEAFVARMNRRARELGMTKTRYFSPNGLPPNAKLGYPWKDFNVSTARDQLKLAVELVKHPEIRVFTSVLSCDLIATEGGYRVSPVAVVNQPLAETRLKPSEKIVRRLENHNNIMCNAKLRVLNPDGRNAVDGFKTGYIDDGGSSIILTAQRDGKRVLVVVLGSKAAAVRDANARRILADALGSLVW